MKYTELMNELETAEAEVTRLMQLLFLERVQVMAPVVQRIRAEGYRVEFLDEDRAVIPAQWSLVNREQVAPMAWSLTAWSGKNCLGEIAWNWNEAEPLAHHTIEMGGFL